MTIRLGNTGHLSMSLLPCRYLHINNDNLLILKCFIRIYIPILVIIARESTDSLLILIFQLYFEFVKVVQRILILC